jgi:endonuclease/exonuclease/phosphatase family metal-dependent hydrolase
MRRIVPGLAILLLIAGCSDRHQAIEPLMSSIQAADPISVMTRNLYLGADIDVILDPTADLSTVVETAFGQIMVTDYRARAVVLAQEIHDRQPHAVGLQEVSHYSLHTAPFGPSIPYPPLGMPLDFIDVLISELDDLGSSYVLAERLYNLEAYLPLPPAYGGLFIRYSDGEAILVRGDVGVETTGASHFATQQQLMIGGMQFANLRGYVWADLTVNGTSFRFVSTHLEIQRFRSVQEAQATELAAALTGSSMPVVLVGDFNSAANHDAPLESRTGSYHMLRNSGFADLWLREPHSAGGVTCCQAPDLSNTTSLLDQRLDLVLVRWGPAGFGGRSSVDLFGHRPADVFVHDLGYTLWPSDHAGLLARIWPAPGRVPR